MLHAVQFRDAAIKHCCECVWVFAGEDVCVCVRSVHTTEMLIRDIERHFALVLSDDKITRPEVSLFAL